MTIAEELPPFSEILRREASFFVFGKKDDREAFVEHLVENDNHGLIAHRGFTTDINKADVFVFLLGKYSDIEFAPWQTELESVYKKVEAADPTSLSFQSRTTLNGDDVVFVFFNMSSVSGAPIKCFALDILSLLKNGNNVESVWESDECKSQD